MREIIIGTRGSDLALWQANTVKRQLEDLGAQVALKIIKTKGDQIQHLAFDKIEGKGFFTKELEEELLGCSIDLAVHSHKDLETTQPEGLVIAAVSEREDPSDLLLIREELADASLKYQLRPGAVTGTSSARRKAQLLHLCPDISIRDIRGNVPTRIQKLRNGEYDAILLATAGVKRLGCDLSGLVQVKMDVTEFVPAPAQGVLALQIRASDTELAHILKSLDHAEVSECIGVERRVLSLFQGGCQLPLGAYCTRRGENLELTVSHATAWDKVPEKIVITSPVAEGFAEQAVEMLRLKKKSNC